MTEVWNGHQKDYVLFKKNNYKKNLKTNISNLSYIVMQIMHKTWMTTDMPKNMCLYVGNGIVG